MKSRQRRLRAIELTLTPQQVVVVWLRNVLQAGTLKDGALHSPPYRGVLANAVYKAVRNGMKGQPESLVERAILQGRREADLLYQLVVNANMAVLDSRAQREREYIFLLGYLSAEMNGKVTKERVDRLRLAFLMFIESVIILDAAIAQIVGEHLHGQPVLFRDCEMKLREELELAETLSKQFNLLAAALNIVEIDLDQLRDSLQSEADRKVSIWVHLARVEMLSLFGKTEEMHVAMEQVSTLAREQPRDH